MALAATLRKYGITLNGGGLGEVMIKFNAVVAINIAVVYQWPTTSFAATAVSFVKEKSGCRSVAHFVLV
ncbi:hypothetical protein ACHAXR_008464 [Thalassiosira sp. AJA248-18]